MYFIAFFGFLVVLLSLVMIAVPDYFAEGIVSFSRKRWFHPFEIITRFAFGLAFVLFADQTLYPNLMIFIGCLLIAVSFGLFFMPVSKHKEFAAWSANKFKKLFRFMGFGSLAFGVFLIYASVRG